MRPSLIGCCMLLLHLAPARSAYTCHLSVPGRERSALSGVSMRRHRPCRAQSVARDSVQGEEDRPSRPSRRSFQPSLYSDPVPDSIPTDSGYVLGADSIPPVLDALRGGSFVLLAEDASDDTTVSLILAPQHATAEHVEFLKKHARLPRLAMESERYTSVYSLLHKMPLDDSEAEPPAISVSALGGDRDPMNSTHVAETLRALAREPVEAQGLRCPGVVSLARAAKGGLLKRAGATEAAVGLARLAGLEPHVALQAELRGASWEALTTLAAEEGIPFTTTADVVAHMRRVDEPLVEKCGLPAKMPTKHGLFMAHCFKSLVDGIEHIALVKAPEGADDDAPFADSSKPALVRVHSECCTGDIFGSLRCDCGPQLEAALQAIEADGYGVVLYLRGQEGRGIGLGAKMHAYALQERGADTLDANTQLGLPVDSREYGTGAQILVSLGIRNMRLMSNNPKKFSGLAGYGLRITERVASKTTPNPNNIQYLRTKAERMGHMLDESLMEKYEYDGASIYDGFDDMTSSKEW